MHVHHASLTSFSQHESPVNDIDVHGFRTACGLVQRAAGHGVDVARSDGARDSSNGARARAVAHYELMYDHSTSITANCDWVMQSNSRNRRAGTQRERCRA